MNTIIEDHKEELVRLCRQYHVQSLEVFGSAVTDRFDPQRSDLDFLVTFRKEDIPHGEYANNYFGLLFALEDLFQRQIDLVTTTWLRNPYFIAEIAKTRTLFYAA